ncbi:hypothetical protein FRB96_007174 [Tulasnella sp. 330]|nr:hypothetical protein FRB96_007174 [Tulasnella sp. 330]KAG8879306.1 hypothetical protein FRB97_001789 [Tulasnella sp. 331]
MENGATIANDGDFDNTPTNLTKPTTAATLTIRVIKSFTFRTERSLVLHDVDLESTTVWQLKERVKQAVKTQPGWKPYRTVELDTLKLYTQAHGSKTTNLIINLDNDEWIFSDDSAMLINLGLENESEISFFNLALYQAFKQDPETKWE